MRKRIGLILFGTSDLSVIAYKDAGMFLYELAKNNGWSAKYLFFKTQYENPIWPNSFLEYVKPICIGETSDYKAQVNMASCYIRKHASDFEVMMFFNYGSTIWRLARLCKLYNPSLVVYDKLDMGHGGYSHFQNDKFFRFIKNYFEKVKSRYVDWFTVETESYFNSLRDNIVFQNRIGYLPNGVSLMDIDQKAISSVNKENILITVGRVGSYAKNSELLIDSIEKLPLDVLQSWKFYFVGPYTDAFYQYVKNKKKDFPQLENQLTLTGDIRNRNDLYALYAKAKIICMTSRTESVCISVIEAMYFSVYPIITYYSDFAIDATNNCTCGRIISNDANEIDNVLLEEMTDSSLGEKGEKAKLYAQEHFSYKILSSVEPLPYI